MSSQQPACGPLRSRSPWRRGPEAISGRHAKSANEPSSGRLPLKHVRRCAWLPVTALLLLAAVPAPARDYPSRHITLVMAFPPGGGSDAAARLVSEHMAASLGQPIVMEAVTGAGGMIGAARVARRPRRLHAAGPLGRARERGHAVPEALFRSREGPRADWAHHRQPGDPRRPQVAAGRHARRSRRLDTARRDGEVRMPGRGSVAHLCAAQFVQARRRSSSGRAFAAMTKAPRPRRRRALRLRAPAARPYGVA